MINSLLCGSVTLLKFIQKLNHTDSSHYRNENQLAVWMILEIFERFQLKPTIDRPEYWLSAICLEQLWNTAFCPRCIW